MAQAFSSLPPSMARAPGNFDRSVARFTEWLRPALEVAIAGVRGKERSIETKDAALNPHAGGDGYAPQVGQTVHEFSGFQPAAERAAAVFHHAVGRKAVGQRGKDVRQFVNVAPIDVTVVLGGPHLIVRGFQIDDVADRNGEPAPQVAVPGDPQQGYLAGSAGPNDVADHLFDAIAQQA